MIDMVFATANDINLIIENFMYKDVSGIKDNSSSKQDESNLRKPSVQNSNENKSMVDIYNFKFNFYLERSIECVAVKNVKIELNLNNNVNVNVSNQNGILQNANNNAPSNEKSNLN